MTGLQIISWVVALVVWAGGRGGHHGLSRPAEEPGAATSYDQVGG